MADAKDERIAELEARIDGLVDALVKMAGQQVYPVVIPIGPPCQRPHADVPTGPYYPSYPYPGTTWGSTTSASYDGSKTVVVN